MTWLIAYDIACPRRWRRLYRLVRQYGVRVQWSVFVVTQAPFHRGAFLAQAAKILEPASDDLRLYRIAGKVSGPPTGTGLIRPPTGVHWRAAPSRHSRLESRREA